MTQEIGWGKACKETLNKYNLPSDFQAIKRLGKNEWMQIVTKAIEKSNMERLLEDLHKMEHGERKIKTKTASIVNSVQKTDYQRRALPEIMKFCQQKNKSYYHC